MKLDKMRHKVRRAGEQMGHRETISKEDLVPQTHQGANDDFNVDSYWLGPNGEIVPAMFLLGDLCTWNYEARGYRLMKDRRQDC